MAERCRMHLSTELQRLLDMAARTADEAGVRVYAVGGCVRDLLLGVRNEDLDLTVEGDGVGFARCLAATIEGTMKAPSAFGTATVLTREGHKIDIATARRETYPHPAALPTVEPGTIREDLFRRDFTINTLAFALNGPEPFHVLDWYGGRADLLAGVIRVLHNRSFRDDPTRVFRAIRLEQRFGFVLHYHTLRLLHRAVDKGWIAVLSGARLWRELRLMLEGESPVQCLKRIDELAVLPQIDIGLALSQATTDVLMRVRDARMELAEIASDIVGRAWPAYFAALLHDADGGVIQRVCARLALSPRVTQELISGLTAVRAACSRLRTDGDLPPSEIVATLRALPVELVPLILGCCPATEVRERVRRYITSWRFVRPCLTGDDLKRLGVAQGPRIGQLLARVLAAKLDGGAPTQEAEEAFVRRLLTQQQVS